MAAFADHAEVSDGVALVNCNYGRVRKVLVEDVHMTLVVSIHMVLAEDDHIHIQDVDIEVVLVGGDLVAGDLLLFVPCFQSIEDRKKNVGLHCLSVVFLDWRPDSFQPFFLPFADIV